MLFLVIFLSVLKMNSVASTFTYQVIFIQISIIHDNISSQVVDKKKIGF